MVAESAIKMEKWWRKMPLKQQSDGKKRHHISNCGGILTTTYHIQGAGAPAKTENHVNADAFIFFREKVRPFPHLAKPVLSAVFFYLFFNIFNMFSVEFSF